MRKGLTWKIEGTKLKNVTTSGGTAITLPREGASERSLFKVESGINGLLPTSWVPSIYSVSPLSWLRSALGGYCILRSIALSSFLATVSQPQKLLVLWSGKQKQVDLHFECGREFNKNDDTGGTFYRSIGIGSAMAGGRMPL